MAWGPNKLFYIRGSVTAKAARSAFWSARAHMAGEASKWNAPRLNVSSTRGIAALAASSPIVLDFAFLSISWFSLDAG